MARLCPVADISGVKSLCPLVYKKSTEIERRRVFVDLDQYVRERTQRRSVGLAAAQKNEMID